MNISEIRPIPGFSSYGASADGRVWRIIRHDRGVAATWNVPHPLKLRMDRYGYPKVWLCRDGKQYPRTVARLMLETFVGPRPLGHECAHNNGVRADSRLENLRWATSVENKADMKRHGTQPMGVDQVNAKLTDAAVWELRQLHARGVTYADLGRQFGVSNVTARLAALRVTWRHV